MNRVEYDFGPLRTPEGVVFRLWAPETASVCVEIDDRSYPMEIDRRGWYVTDAIDVADGVPYGFRINENLLVPDPASRMQEEDVHDRSVLVTSPPEFDRSGHHVDWFDAVIYELHVGTFTEGGTFLDAIAQLDRLKELGITIIELMPIADFPGRWNWGYDGVLPFAPDRAYGTPGELAKLIDAIHQRGLAVVLDVVYNHFGPDGNYLHVYSPEFFSEEIETPWGKGIDFRRPEVRRFFIENAIYWIEWYRFDGLRFDAVHAIEDPSVADGSPHILTELAKTIRSSTTRQQPPHLILENDKNQARYLSPDLYTAQWNDDIHHGFHVLLTGEDGGYYGDYQGDTEALLFRGLTEGFIYQGQPSPGSGENRGEPSSHISPTRFISFLQNHDQIGNRAWGERLRHVAATAAVDAATTALLLSPQTPMIFMGEEVDAGEPFQFFCDFGEPLAQAVRTGRQREFGLDDIPDPVEEETKQRCCTAPYRENNTTELYRRLLALRRDHLRPLLPELRSGSVIGGGDTVPVAAWEGSRVRWCVAANLSDRARPLPYLPPTKPIIPQDSSIATAIPAWTTIVWKETR